jgi:hypothetical protein
VTPDAMKRELADLRRLVNQLMERQRQPYQVPLTITMASHGFVTGDVIRPDSSSYAKAKADTSANSRWLGMVAKLSDNVFSLYLPGMRINGLTSLSSGSLYYLDASTAGAITATAPNLSIPVLHAFSTTGGHLLSSTGEWVELDTCESGVAKKRMFNCGPAY